MPKITLLISIIILLGFLYCEKRIISSAGRGSVAGTVHTAKDSIPLEGVTVRLVGTATSVQTESTGSFLLSDLPPDEINIYFSKEHYNSHMELFFLGDGQNLVMEDTVYLSRDYGVIAGIVLDSDSDMPIPLANVLLRRDDTCLVIDSTITGTAGHFILPYVDSDTSGYLISIEKQGFQTLAFNQPVSDDDSVFLIKFLQAYVTISGMIFDNDSTTPLPNVSVSVDSQLVQSDSSGRFTIAGMLPADTGYLFTVSKEYYNPLSFRDTITSTDTLLKPIYLQRKTGALQGYFRLQGQLNHAGVIVRLPSADLSDTTDSLGSIEILTIPAGIQEIVASKEKFRVLTDSIEIKGEDTTQKEFDLVIQSGIIHTVVNWFSVHLPYLIQDTLEIATGGALYVNAGVALAMMSNSRLLTSGSGIVRTLGEKDRLVVVSPSPPSAGNIEIRITIPPRYDVNMTYTMIQNVKTTFVGYPIIEHCLFVHINDTSADNSMYINPTYIIPAEKKAKDERVNFSQCDFIRINSVREGIYIQDSLVSDSTTPAISFSKCSFYLSADSPGCKNFLESTNRSSGIINRITDCNFYADCSLPYPLFELINHDTSYIRQVDPAYVDRETLDFHLKKDSPLLGDNVHYLGALGSGEINRRKQ